MQIDLEKLDRVCGGFGSAKARSDKPLSEQEQMNLLTTHDPADISKNIGRLMNTTVSRSVLKAGTL